MEEKAQETQPSGVEVKSRLRAGRLVANENETLLGVPAVGAEQVAKQPQASGIQVKTQLRAGRLVGNENETLLGVPALGAELPSPSDQK